MFPANDTDWITYIPFAIPQNVTPCWVDIVGDVGYPAAYYYLDPIGDPNPTDVAFRMRLNGDPLSNNPNVYRLKEFVWGVVIRSNSNAVLFTVLVNASGGNYNLQVMNSSSVLVYDVPITLNSPSQATDNVRVVDAGAEFPCGGPVIPDEDYFLDFTLPTNIFSGFNFVSSTYRLCYFTSTQDNNINKEFVCGMIINPPAGTPVLCVTKQIMSGPSTACTNDTHSWLLLITIYNCGTVPATDVVMTDTLNGSMVFTAAPIFIPNADVTYDAGTRVVTWNVGTLDPGDAVSFVIILTGYFAVPGHHILDSGTVNGTDLTPVIFGDHGILIYGQNQLTAEKQILSGPLSIEKCKISTWTFRITVENTDVSDIPNVLVIDQLNSCFTVESGPQFTASAGNASFVGNEIIWAIDNLAGNSAETLLVTVTGFFSCEGHIILDSGFLHDKCDQTIAFQDTGVDVTPIVIPQNIRIGGDILDCKTDELLSGVSATVYNQNCKVIQTDSFDGHYELSLPAGTYSVLFEKEGYQKKFLSLVLQSDADLSADLYLAPKAAVSVQTADEGSANANIDLFSGIICEKIDAMIIYSSFICVNSNAQVECLSDVIDSFSCSLVCPSKLHLTLNLEKNLVYRLDRFKDFVYDTRKVPVCYPLRNGGNCTKQRCYAKVRRVCHCKEHNLVYNIAYLDFIAYLLIEDDIFISGTPLDEC